MLVSLSIRDFVLIEKLDLNFSVGSRGGLDALTGETGAGKSILIDALGLALGARADTGTVRRGAGQASVAASFELPANHPAFGKGFLDGKPAAYVCEGPVCSLPITDAESLLETLSRVR